MNRDEIAITQENVELAGLYTVPSAFGDSHRMRHEEQVISVFVDLCPMDLRGALLNRQRMKPESLLHQLEVSVVRRLKVDPAHFAFTRRHGAVGTFENFQTRGFESDCAEHLGSFAPCLSGRRACVERAQMNFR
jgi:hypothetical protein